MPTQSRLDLLISIDAKTAALVEVNQKMAELRGNMSKLSAMVGPGFSFAIGSQIASALSAIPAAFSNAISTGVRFNATLETAQLGVGAVLRQFDPGKYYNFQEALKASADAVELLKQKAVESPASVSQLVSAFQGVSGAATAAGIPLQKQVDLVVLMSQALSGLGIRSEQILQESRALLTGNITEDAMAARILGITKADIDGAKQQGQLYEFLTGKLSAFAEAGKIGQETFTTSLSNLGDAFEQLSGKVAEPVFDILKKSFLELTEELKKPEVAESLRVLGGDLGQILKIGVSLVEVAIKNAAAIAKLGEAAVVAGLAVGAIKLGGLLVALGKNAVALVASARAYDAETAAMLRNSRAKTFLPGGSGAITALPRNTTQPLSMAGVLSAVGVAAGTGLAIGLVIKSLVDAWTGEIERVNRSLETMGENFEKARTRLATLVAEASTPEKKNALPEEFEKEIEAVKAKLVELDRLRNSFSGDLFQRADTFTGGQGYTAAIEAAQNELALLERQKASASELAGIDTARFRERLAAADTAEKKLDAQKAIEERIGQLLGENTTLAERQIPILGDLLKLSGGRSLEEVKVAMAMERQLVANQKLQADVAANAGKTYANMWQDMSPQEQEAQMRPRLNATAQNLSTTLQGTAFADTTPDQLATMKASELGSLQARIEAQGPLVASDPLGTEDIAEKAQIARLILDLQTQRIALDPIEKANAAAETQSEERLWQLGKDKLLTQEKANDLEEQITSPIEHQLALETEIRALRKSMAGELETGLVTEGQLVDMAKAKVELAEREKTAKSAPPEAAPAIPLNDERGSAALPDPTWASVWENYFTQVQTMGAQTAALIRSNLESAVSGISNAITQAVMGTKTWAQAFADFGKTALSTLIQMTTEMILQNVIRMVAQGLMKTMGALGITLMATETSASTASSATKAAAAAPAALLTSISSYGVAAAIGLAAIIAVVASFGGFAEGGYTGGGGKYEPAGVVHKGEYVFTQEQTRRLGVSNLERLSKMPTGIQPMAGYAEGGLVGGTGAGALQPLRDESASGGGRVNVEAPKVNVAVVNSRSELNRWAQSSEGSSYIGEMIDGQLRTRAL